MPVSVRVEAVEGRAVVTKVGSGAQAAVVRAEAERLRAAAHPGVVELLDAGPSTDGWQHRTVHGGRPLDGIGRLPVEQAAAVVAATAETIADLHELGVVHGRIGADHVLLGTSGRPQLCGLGPGRHEPAASAAPADDVAALGRLLRSLVGDDTDPDPIPERRWGRRRWGGPARRPLLDLADQATAEPPTLRPTARRLARAVVEAVPEARLVPPVDPPPTETPPAVRPSRVGPRHAAAAPAARFPRVLPAAAALTGVALVAVGVARAVDDPPGPSRPPPTTTSAPAATPVPSYEPAPTTTAAAPPAGPAPVPAGCPPVDQPGPDLDGDGCPDPVLVEGTTIVVGDHRFEVARAGEVVVLGDWDCDGTVTPAALRSGTGEVFAFPRWPDGTEEVGVEAVDRVPGATALALEPLGSGCDGLTVEVPGRGRVRVSGVGR